MSLLHSMRPNPFINLTEDANYSRCNSTLRFPEMFKGLLVASAFLATFASVGLAQAQPPPPDSERQSVNIHGARAFANGLASVHGEVQQIIHQATGERPDGHPEEEDDSKVAQFTNEASEHLVFAQSNADTADDYVSNGHFHAAEVALIDACTFANLALSDLSRAQHAALHFPPSNWTPLAPAYQATQSHLKDVMNQAGCP